MLVAVIVLAAVLVLGTAFLAYRTMQGRIPFDVGLGRSVIRLEPRSVHVRARRPMLFGMLTALGKGGATGVRERDRVEVLEKTDELIVAEWWTDTGRGVTRSVEAIRLYPEERITFRHLRGSFPAANEEFRLEEVETGTILHHRAEFAIDLGPIGRLAARLYLKPSFERLVDEHMASIKRAAEERAARSKVYPMPPGPAEEQPVRRRPASGESP